MNNKPNVLTKKQLKAKTNASTYARIIPSYAYNPPPKPPSRRDLWRMEVAERKSLNQ